MKHTYLRMLSLLCAMLLLGSLALTACGEQPAEEKKENQDAPAAVAIHNHQTPVDMDVFITGTEEGTFICSVKDCEGNILFEETGIPRKPFTETVSDNVFALSWPTGTGTTEFISVYFNRQTCQTSGALQAPLATDGVRVVMPQGDNEKGYSVLVRDIFDPTVYSKTYPLDDAFTGKPSAIMGGKMVDKTHAIVTYYTGENGEHRTIEYNLYEDKSAEAKK